MSNTHQQPHPGPQWTPPSAEEITLQYHARIYAWCNKFLGNDRDAEDATQDVSIRILRSTSKASFQSEGDVAKWVHTITKNRCWDVLRKRKRQRQNVDNYATSKRAAITESFESPDSMDSEALQHVLSLAESDRNVRIFMLQHLEGLSLDQIETRLQITKSTAKKGNQRGREAVMHLLLPKLRTTTVVPCSHVHLSMSMPRFAIGVYAVSVPSAGHPIVTIVDSDTFEGRSDPPNPWLGDSKKKSRGLADTNVLENRSTGGDGFEAVQSGAKSFIVENGASWIVWKAAQSPKLQQPSKKQVSPSSRLVTECRDVLATVNARRSVARDCVWFCFKATEKGRS